MIKFLTGGSGALNFASDPRLDAKLNDLLARAPQIQRQAGASGTPPVTRSSDAGRGFVKAYEKFREKRYPTDGSNTPTIGWGHVVRPDEPFTDGITLDEADRLFDDEFAHHEDIVRRSVKVPLTQQQFDALSSLAYNAPSAFHPDSGLLKSLNAGDYAAAGEAISHYNHVGQAVSKGLTKRRNQERQMFLDGNYDSRH